MTIEFYFKYHISEALGNPVTRCFFLCTIILPFGISVILKKTYGKIVRRVGLLAFSFYIICAMTLLNRMDSGSSALNLNLFWTWERALEGSAKHQYFIMGNILLFVPYGVAVSALFSKEKCRWWKLLVIGVTTSVAIEYIQFVAHVGLCELDDVIHNTIGMMVGYGAVMVWRYVCRRIRADRE